MFLRYPNCRVCERSSGIIFGSHLVHVATERMQTLSLRHLDVLRHKFKFIRYFLALYEVRDNLMCEVCASIGNKSFNTSMGN
jgi:hypothetical protein